MFMFDVTLSATRVDHDADLGHDVDDQPLYVGDSLSERESLAAEPCFSGRLPPCTNGPRYICQHMLLLLHRSWLLLHWGWRRLDWAHSSSNHHINAAAAAACCAATTDNLSALVVRHPAQFAVAEAAPGPAV
jgi:hypothetical protein